MESSAYSSPRNDVFPAGLRVLVVDDDPTWLKILEKMLKKCSYDVITCGLAKEALNLIRERKDGFDIVISDVNMPDMDGFKLLEHVGLEMDLPVIMMSVDGETSRVMKGVQHGACDYLLKPIRMKELRNIWQHVLRKRIHEVRDIECHEESLEENLPCVNDLNSGKKRKEFENKHDGREYNEPSSAKKTRVVWTIDLHQKFVKAVNQIGLEKVGPKKILDLMNVPWLTRENIASHLQKYRLYLSRLQGNRSTKEHNGNRDFSSKTMHNIDFQIQEDDMKCIVPKGVEEPKKVLSFTPSFGQCDFRQPFEPIGFNLLSIPTVHTSVEFECPQLGSCVKSKPSSISREIEGGDKLLHHKISTCDLFSILSSQGLKTHQDSVQQVVDSETSVNGFGFWDENPPQRCLPQSDFQPIESLDYTDPKVIAEVPDYLYEYPLDSMEYSVIDHGVYIM